MAFAGHISWQQKQRMQALGTICAFPFSTVMVCPGHISAHLPQPMHLLRWIFGRGASHFSTPGTAQRSARGALSAKLMSAKPAGSL